MGINYIHTETIHNSKAAEEVLPYLFNLIKPHSVIDFGCGTGSWLKIAKQLGAKKILGIDGVHVNKEMLCINEGEFLQHNLTLPLTIEGRYDLAMCLEVVEHLPEEAADNAISLITASADILLFSAAIPGQGGQFHLNEQWPDYWQNKLKAHGFLPCDNLRQKFWDNDNVEWWYKQNMVLYVKPGIASKLNLEITKDLPVYIHPYLLNDKLQKLHIAEEHINYLEDIINKEITKPKFFPSLKRLIKSVTG